MRVVHVVEGQWSERPPWLDDHRVARLRALDTLEDERRLEIDASRFRVTGVTGIVQVGAGGLAISPKVTPAPTGIPDSSWLRVVWQMLRLTRAVPRDMPAAGRSGLDAPVDLLAQTVARTLRRTGVPLTRTRVSRTSRSLAGRLDPAHFDRLLLPLPDWRLRVTAHVMGPHAGRVLHWTLATLADETSLRRVASELRRWSSQLAGTSRTPTYRDLLFAHQEAPMLGPIFWSARMLLLGRPGYGPAGEQCVGILHPTDDLWEAVARRVLELVLGPSTKPSLVLGVPWRGSRDKSDWLHTEPDIVPLHLAVVADAKNKVLRADGRPSPEDRYQVLVGAKLRDALGALLVYPTWDAFRVRRWDLQPELAPMGLVIVELPIRQLAAPNALARLGSNLREALGSVGW